MRFPTAHPGFSSIHGTLFGFYGIYMVFDVWILLSAVAEHSKMCRISIVRYRICYCLLYTSDAADE